MESSVKQLKKRVYLDTQVISTCVENKQLKELILQKRETVNFYYSPAHAEEILNFKADDEKREQEIKFIINLTQNKAIYPNDKGLRARFRGRSFRGCIYECKEILGGEVATHKAEEIDKSNVAKFRKEKFDNLPEKKRDKLIKIINSIPETDILRATFPYKTCEKLKQLDLVPDTYQLKNACKLIFDLKWDENVISQYNDKPFSPGILESFFGSDSFDTKEEVIDILMIYLNCIYWHADKNSYIGNRIKTEFVGNTQNENLKSGKHGMTHDVTHVMYASMVDVFVSNDKSLRCRAKAVYNRLGIKTEVMCMNDFVNRF